MLPGFKVWVSLASRLLESGSLDTFGYVKLQWRFVNLWRQFEALCYPSSFEQICVHDYIDAGWSTMTHTLASRKVKHSCVDTCRYLIIASARYWVFYLYYQSEIPPRLPASVGVTSCSSTHQSYAFLAQPMPEWMNNIYHRVTLSRIIFR